MYATQDVNFLRRLLESGVLSPEDAQNITPDQQNQLAQLLQQPEQMPQPRFDVAPVQQNTMRVENGPEAGKVTPLDFSAQQAQAQAPQRIKVAGYSNGGIMSDIGQTDATVPPIDYSRPAVETPRGKGYYGKDGAIYVKGSDGSVTKILQGYDPNASYLAAKRDFELRKGEADIAQSQAATEHTQEATRASKVNNPDYQQGVVNPGATGEAALAGLDPGTAATVKAYAEGKLAFPQGAAMRSPRMMQLLNLVAAYDPTFDATDFNARNKTLAGFTAGRQGDAVRAVNQAIAHAGSLQDSIDKLDNFNGIATPLNAPVNYIEQALGDTRQGTFKQNAVALASELRKVFAGSGGGSLSELQSWEAGLPVNASKEQQTAYLRKGLDLLQGAIGALNDQYSRGMGPRANVMDILSPKAKETLGRLTGESPDIVTSATQSGQVSGIPQGAIDKLKANPQLRTAFDMKYGRGAAAQVLGQ